VADQLPSGERRHEAGRPVDVAAWVKGESLQTVQWDEYGGFKINFKAFAIGVPLIRSDARVGRASFTSYTHRARGLHSGPTSRGPLDAFFQESINGP
jgi:hypothetical protein